MKQFKVTYSYETKPYSRYYTYVDAKDEDDAKLKAKIELDNDDTKGIIIEDAIDTNLPYIQRGFKNRMEYLCSLVEEYNVLPEEVFSLAEIYGPSEDFDGLISTLEDKLYY